MSIIRVFLILIAVFSHIAHSQRAAFTEQELAFIAKNPKIMVGSVSHNYPYFFTNQQTLNGISRDYLELVSKRSGLTFEYSFPLSSNEAKLALQENRIHILPNHLKPNRIDASPSWFSLPYEDIHVYLFTLKQANGVKSFAQFSGKVGFVSTFINDVDYIEDIPTITSVEFQTQEAAFNELIAGEIDAVIEDIVVANNLLSKLNIQNIKANVAVEGLQGLEVNFLISHENPLVKDIFDKALSQISWLEKNEINEKWLNNYHSQQTISGAFGYARPPFMYDQSSPVGFERSILEEAFKLMGLRIGEIEQVPTIAGNTILQTRKDLQFSAGVPFVENELFYSDSITDYSNVAITRTKDDITLDNIADLTNHKVATFADASSLIGGEFKTFFNPKNAPKSYQEFVVQDAAIDNFLKGEAEVIIGDINIIFWRIQNANFTSPYNRKHYQVHRLFNSDASYQVAFQDKALRDAFNAALTTLKERGTYERMLDLYKDGDLTAHIARANLIAKLSAPYILNQDIESLAKLLQVFAEGGDLPAVTYYSNLTEELLASFELIAGQYEINNFANRNHLNKISKPSVLDDSGNISILGVTSLFIELTSLDDFNLVYIPPLRKFSSFPPPEFAKIEAIYQTLSIAEQSLSLTPEEIAWRNQNPVAKVGIDPNYLPFEALDNEGNYIGLVADYLNELSSISGLKLEPQIVESWDGTVELVKEQKVDLASAGTTNPLFEQYYAPITPFVQAKLAIVMNRKNRFIESLNELTNQKVAILVSAANTETLMTQYSSIDWMTYPSTIKSLQALSAGEVDAVIDSSFVINHLIKSENMDTLNVVGQLDFTVASTFQVLKNKPHLFSILDKAVKSIPQEKHREFEDKWFGYQQEQQIDYTLIWQIAIAAAVIIFFIVLWNRKLVEQVNARKAAEQRLAEREQQLLAMLNTAPVAVAIIQDGTAVFTNDTALAMFGLTQDNITGFNVTDIYTDLNVRNENIAKVQEQGRLENREVEFKRTDNSVFSGSASYYIIDYLEKPALLFWCYDISELKHLNNQLTIAIDSAEQANKAKSDFLANMSHEIRTPMNAIIGMSNLALQGTLAAKERNYVNKVNKAAGSLLGIINDILDFSKIEAGQLSIEVIPFELKEVFHNLANIIAIKTQEKRLECIFDIDDKVPHELIGDPLRLGQILLNLGSNAVKFTKSGHVKFSVSVHSRKDDEITLLYSVNDTGIGLSEEQQQKLFKSFSQADSSTTRKYGGTGLGLTISKRLVEMMAGDIWLDSKLGYGSKFSFTAKFKLSEHASDFGSDFNWGNYTNLPNIQWLQVNPVSSNLLAQSLSNYPNSVTQRTECSDFDMATSDQLFIIDGDVDINNVTECLEKATSNSIRVIVTSILDTSDYPINLSEYPNTQLLVKPYLGHQLFELITETHNVTSESELLSPSKQTSQMNKLAGAHLLLVEDNELNQELATDLLASINITVDIANNGQEAVDKSEQGDYDGILMDIQMPVLDGISATKIIRQVDVKIPIIAMTANAMAGDREHVIEAGMNSYISKPIDFKLMIKTLSDWITPKHKEAPAQITETPKQPLSLPSFEHIDLEAGMIVTNNNSALYLKLLNKFSKAHKSFKEDLLVSLNDCDWETAIRLAHTLKGTSANIGAEKVQELAAILELECKREAVAQSTIDKCNETLTAVLTELSEKLAKDGDVKLSGNNKTLNEADIAGELDELRSLIDDFDANAQDIVEILLTKNLEEALQNAIVNISKALENYDFERAEAELEKL